MGVVFEAQDGRLERRVAIKVLPETLAQNPERLARFEREAKVLASLNHANIAQIYGLETGGESAARVRALVMELVEGPTLDERLAGGALPVAEALTIARQIAEALEQAHARGVVHRDLKPQNVKLAGNRFLAMELVPGETLADRLARGRLALDEALAVARQIADALAAAHEQGEVQVDGDQAGERARAQARPQRRPPPGALRHRPSSHASDARTKRRAPGARAASTGRFPAAPGLPSVSLAWNRKQLFSYSMHGIRSCAHRSPGETRA